MPNKSFLYILLLLVFMVSFSGCTSTKNAMNGTFGERTISLSNITVLKNISNENSLVNGTHYYQIKGSLKNNNKYDVFNLKMKALVYDAEGKLVAENSPSYVSSKVLPAEGELYFIFSFIDNDERIVRYEIQVISAEAEP